MVRWFKAEDSRHIEEEEEEEGGQRVCATESSRSNELGKGARVAQFARTPPHTTKHGEQSVCMRNRRVCAEGRWQRMVVHNWQLVNLLI